MHKTPSPHPRGLILPSSWAFRKGRRTSYDHASHKKSCHEHFPVVIQQRMPRISLCIIRLKKKQMIFWKLEKQRMGPRKFKAEKPYQCVHLATTYQAQEERWGGIRAQCVVSFTPSFFPLS
jgi:hypothetical protein